jgi:hypothetical protein
MRLPCYTLSQPIFALGIALDVSFIVYGGYEIYDGNYASGIIDVSLGFLGIGVIGGGFKFVKFTAGPLNRIIRLKYIDALRSLSTVVGDLQKIGTPSKIWLVM